MDDTELLTVFLDRRALQNFQESQRELRRGEGINVIKGVTETSVSFVRQAGNQVEMNRDHLRLRQFLHDFLDLVDLRRPVDRQKRVLIGGLYADLELYRARTHLPENIDLLFIHQLGSDLEVEVRRAVIVLEDIVPDGLRAVFVAVKSPVDELDQGDVLVKEELQFLKDERQAPVTHGLINRGEAVAAAERASSGRLVIDDPVVEVRHVFFVDEWKGIEACELMLDHARTLAQCDVRDV